MSVVSAGLVPFMSSMSSLVAETLIESTRLVTVGREGMDSAGSAVGLHLQLRFTALSGPVVAADMLISDMLCALCPLARHHHADIVEYRCLLAATSVLVAFHVGELGSQYILRSSMGYQQQKKR